MSDRWAVILGVSSGTGAAIARAVARDPGLNIFGVHRGHYPDGAAAVARDVQALGRKVWLHVGDAGLPDSIAQCVAAYRDVAGSATARLLVHSIAGASLGHFLSTRGDALHPKQFEKTFNYMAHSFAYWGQALYEGDLLAPGALLLGLTNVLHDSLLHNCGLIAAAKAALQVYVRHLAIELGPFGHRVNLLKFGTMATPALQVMMGPNAMRRLEQAHQEMTPAGRMVTAEEVSGVVSLLLRPEAAWFNGATIDFSGGMALRLLDVILRPD